MVLGMTFLNNLRILKICEVQSMSPENIKMFEEFQSFFVAENVDAICIKMVLQKLNPNSKRFYIGW